MAKQNVLAHWRDAYRVLYYLGGLSVAMGLASEFLPHALNVELWMLVPIYLYFVLALLTTESGYGFRIFFAMMLILGSIHLPLGLAGEFLFADFQHQGFGFGAVFLGLLFLRFGYLVQTARSSNAMRIALFLYLLDTICVFVIYALTGAGTIEAIFLFFWQCFIRAICLRFMYHGHTNIQLLNASAASQQKQSQPIPS